MLTIFRISLPRQLEGKQHPLSSGVSAVAVIDPGSARLLHLHGNRRGPALLDPAGGVLPQRPARQGGRPRLQRHNQRSVVGRSAFRRRSYWLSFKFEMTNDWPCFKCACELRIARVWIRGWVVFVDTDLFSQPRRPQRPFILPALFARWPRHQRWLFFSSRLIG